MGRIEKQKRILIEEANRRVLSETLLIVGDPCKDDNGKPIVCPTPPTILEKLSQLNIGEELENLKNVVDFINQKLNNIRCDGKKITSKIGDTTPVTSDVEVEISETLLIRPKKEPCKPGECSPVVINNMILNLYDSIKKVSEDSKTLIPFLNQTPWCEYDKKEKEARLKTIADKKKRFEKRFGKG